MEPRISCTDLLMRLGEEEVLVVDCRNADSGVWTTVRIPGALRMTPEELSLAGHILPDDELIVLCGGGPDLAEARRAWRALLQQGRYAVCLDGGIDAWVRSGYPVERLHVGFAHMPASKLAPGRTAEPAESALD